MPFLGGYGSDYFGELFGGGGPLSVARAIPMAGQVVRVAFNEEPLHKSAAGSRDALNPANYVATVLTGQAVAPTPTVVSKVLALGPARGLVGTTERGIDVGFDRPFVAGMTYRVTVAHLVSALGGALGTPDSADFAGIVVTTQAVQPQKRPTHWDLRSDVATGALVVDNSGDLAPELDLVVNLRKRVFRRLTTPKDAFSHLRGYGVGISHMEPTSYGQIAQYRRECTSQIKLEPEVADASVKIQITNVGAEGVVFLSWSAKLKTGGTASDSFPVPTT